jgi:hypothetical protein
MPNEELFALVPMPLFTSLGLLFGQSGIQVSWTLTCSPVLAHLYADVDRHLDNQLSENFSQHVSA